MFNRNRLILTLVLCLLLQSCNFPADILPPTPGVPPTEPQLTSTPSAIVKPSATSIPVPTSTLIPSSPTATLPATTATSTPVPTGTPTLAEFPVVTFNINANCRLGPSRNYFSHTSFLKDRSTTVEGRNQDGSWLWAKAIEGYCWVSVTTIKDPVSYLFLPIVQFPPLPEPPSQLVVTHKDCTGRFTVGLRWSNVTGETGYNIYRDGITLATLKADSTMFTDYPPAATEYFYEIESINEFGISVRFAQAVQGCIKK